MCITEDKLVESYGKATPRERFRLIYKNYSIFPQLVDCYETGLFNRILFEVEYNRREKNDDDLGVRIYRTCQRSESNLPHRTHPKGDQNLYKYDFQGTAGGSRVQNREIEDGGYVHRR